MQDVNIPRSGSASPSSEHQPSRPHATDPADFSTSMQPSRGGHVWVGELDEYDDLAASLEDERSHLMHCDPPPSYAPRRSLTIRSQDSKSRPPATELDVGGYGNPSGSSLSSMTALFGSMLGVRSSEKIAAEEQIGRLNAEVFSLEKSGRMQEAVLLEEGIDASCRRYGINKWRVTPRPTAQAWMQYKGVEARSFLLRSKDSMAAQGICQLTDMIHMQHPWYGATSTFNELTKLIESKDITVRACLRNRLALASDAVSSASPDDFLSVATTTLAADLQKSLQDKKLEDALVAKDHFFWLAGRLNVKDYLLRKGPKLSMEEIIRSLSLVFEMKTWNPKEVEGRFIYELSASNLQKKHWLSFASTLGLDLSKIFRQTSERPHNSQGSHFLTADWFLLHLRAPETWSFEAANLLHLAFLSDSEEVIPFVDSDWSGKKNPSVAAAESLRIALCDQRTEKKALDFLIEYSRRSSCGPSGLTGLLLDPDCSRMLPEEMKEWLMSPTVPV